MSKNLRYYYVVDTFNDHILATLMTPAPIFKWESLQHGIHIMTPDEYLDWLGKDAE